MGANKRDGKNQSSQFSNLSSGICSEVATIGRQEKRIPGKGDGGNLAIGRADANVRIGIEQ